MQAMRQCEAVSKVWQGTCEDLTACLGQHIPVSPSLCFPGDLDLQMSSSLMILAPQEGLCRCPGMEVVVPGHPGGWGGAVPDHWGLDSRVCLRSDPHLWSGPLGQGH